MSYVIIYVRISLYFTTLKVRFYNQFAYWFIFSFTLLNLQQLVLQQSINGHTSGC